MATLLLKQAVNGVISNLGAGVHPTQGNSIYSLTVEGTSNIPEGLELLREGDDLIFSVKGEEVSRLTEFYSDEMVAQVSVNGSLDAATAEIGTSTLAEIEGGGVVWPESESLATWGEQESLFSPSNLAIGVAAVGGVAVAVDDEDQPAPPPQPTITGGTASATNSDVTFTITFDIPVEGFTADDIVVTGGSKGTFTPVSATEYILTVSPADDSTTQITVDIAEGVAQSLAGTPSLAAVQAIQAVDTLVEAPILSYTDSAASDQITNVATVNVSGLESGASWEYSTDGGSSWSAGGSGNSFELIDGNYASEAVQVRQTDGAGNLSEATKLVAVTIDTAISTPSLELASDSNIEDDRVTNDATIVVSDLDSDASWEYLIGEGSSWLPGSGSSFEITVDGSYDSNVIRVRQTDVAGNVSEEGALQAAVIDTVAPAILGIALDDDTGANASDNISKDGTVVISDLESGATWQYRYDGINWTTGTGTSFVLPEGTYTSVQVQQTDLAGNESGFFDSGSSADLGATVIDKTAPTVTITDNVEGTANGPVVFTFQFSEDVNDFEIDDIDVDGGTKSAFTEVADDEYTVVVTPPDDSETDITVDVADGAAQDTSGNDSTAATQAVQTVAPSSPNTVVIFDFVTGKSSTVGGSRTFSETTDYDIYFIVNSGTVDLTMAGTDTWGGSLKLDADDKLYLIGDTNGATAGGYGAVYEARDRFTTTTLFGTVTRGTVAYTLTSENVVYQWSTSEGDVGFQLFKNPRFGSGIGFGNANRKMTSVTEGFATPIQYFGAPFGSGFSFSMSGDTSSDFAAQSVLNTMPTFRIGTNNYFWNGSSLALTTPP